MAVLLQLNIHKELFANQTEHQESAIIRFVLTRGCKQTQHFPAHFCLQSRAKLQAPTFLETINWFRHVVCLWRQSEQPGQQRILSTGSATIAAWGQSWFICIQNIQATNCWPHYERDPEGCALWSLPIYLSFQVNDLGGKTTTKPLGMRGHFNKETQSKHAGGFHQRITFWKHLYVI